MTKLLQKAFKETSKLPQVEQNAFAKWLLDELHSEAKWDKTFSETEDLLEQMAEDALNDKRRSKITRLKTGRL